MAYTYLASLDSYDVYQCDVCGASVFEVEPTPAVLECSRDVHDKWHANFDDDFTHNNHDHILTYDGIRVCIIDD